MIYILLAIIVWALVGASSFVFWWTTQYDLRTSEIPLVFLASILGPISWFIGRSIHDKTKETEVIVKRRGE